MLFKISIFSLKCYLRIRKDTKLMLPSTRKTPFCLWTLIRVLNCLKGTVGFLVSYYSVLNIFMCRFFAILLVIVVVFFWTGPVKHTFFMCSFCGFLFSSVECAATLLLKWRTTYRVNEWIIISNRNTINIDEVKDKSY